MSNDDYRKLLPSQSVTLFNGKDHPYIRIKTRASVDVDDSDSWSHHILIVVCSE